MSLPIYPMIRPGDSRTLNRLASDVSRLDADLVRGRNAYPDDNKPFMAYISGNLAGAHSWYKLVSMDDGDNDQDGWGLEGTVSGSGNVLPAYALDGSTVATGSVVLMWFADVGSEMRFIPPPSAGGGLDLSGRSGSIADVTALQILRGVISGTAGAAVFTPDDATNSLPGIVSLSDQTMGDGVKTFLDGSANEGGIYVGTNGILAVYDPTIGAKEEHFNINRQAGGSIIEYDWYESTLSSVLLLKAYSAGPNGFMDLRVEWSVAVQGVIAGSASGGADGRFGVNVGGTDFMGASGTSGGGDTVKGGIITTLGTAPDPADIDGGTWV